MTHAPMAHTSFTSPLRITSPRSLPSLGLSLCPGKKDTHALGGPCDRDLEADLDTLRQWGAEVVITLMEKRELCALGVKTLGDAVRGAGMVWWHWPVVDGSALRLPKGQLDTDIWALPCAMLRYVLSLGGKVFVHCRGGLGRTGTLAVRLLIEEGLSLEDALQEVREVRPGAVETLEQEDYLRNLPDLLAHNTHRAVSRACLLGGTLGDALGAPLEFMRRADMEARMDCRSLPQSEGDVLRFTDDTQMTLFTAEALLRAGTLPPIPSPVMPTLQSSLRAAEFQHSTKDDLGQVLETVMVEHYKEAQARAPQRLRVKQPEACMLYMAYRDWRQTQQRPRSQEESAGYGSLLLRYQGLWEQRSPDTTCMASLEAKDFYPHNDRKGSGTIMRAASVGLYVPKGEHSLYNAFELGQQSARLTHGHPVAILAAGLWAVLVHALAHGMLVDEAFETVRKFLFTWRKVQPGKNAKGRRTAYQKGAMRLMESAQLLNGLLLAQKLADNGPAATLPPGLGQGWVAEEALAISLYCALAHLRSEQALCTAIFHDGDSDTTGLLTGQLWGLLHGEQGLPAALLHKLEMRPTLLALADALAALPSAKRKMRDMVNQLWPEPDFTSLTEEGVNAPHSDVMLEGYFGDSNLKHLVVDEKRGV